MKKQIFLAFLTFVFALFSLYFLKIGFDKYLYLIPGLLILPLAWGLAACLIENFRVVLGVSLGSAIALILIFGIQIGYLISAALLFVVLLWGFKKVQKEKTLRIKILIEELAFKGVGWLYFALALVVAVGFYFSPKVQDLKNGIKIPASVSEKILSLAIPDFSQDLTVDQLVNVLMRKPKNEPLAEHTKKQVLEQVGLSDLNLSGQELVSQNPEILDRLVTDKINIVFKGFSDWIPIILAIIIWQTAIWVGKILTPGVAFLDLLIFTGLKNIGFVQIEKVKTEKEEIKL